ncbi:hypothetical protein [Kamptonema formosum]|uniref:hypothetical protein n=1 Tax=Kamptonema formosum TaxID=331992 RepID=UPI0012DD8C88|nr:hypothetical protein [Oscillatoria sp. PCC 10802]
MPESAAISGWDAGAGNSIASNDATFMRTYISHPGAGLTGTPPPVKLKIPNLKSIAGRERQSPAQSNL